ncbi:MAG: hypothetical protein AAGA03_10545 [Planctomycetota bacterium]
MQSFCASKLHEPNRGLDVLFACVLALAGTWTGAAYAQPGSSTLSKNAASESVPAVQSSRSDFDVGVLRQVSPMIMQGVLTSPECARELGLSSEQSLQLNQFVSRWSKTHARTNPRAIGDRSQLATDLLDEALKTLSIEQVRRVREICLHETGLSALKIKHVADRL